MLRNQVIVGASTGAAVGIGLAAMNHILREYRHSRKTRENPCKSKRRKRR
jgi:hypothetical protein